MRAGLDVGGFGVRVAVEEPYVRRALRNGRLKSTKTEGSIRAVPLQAIGLAALDQLRADRASQLLFPSPRGGYFDLHNFRNRYWKPAQIAVGIVPLRRVYDLRHTFATFALRAGISSFDLSRYMGASLTMIDRHYGLRARVRRGRGGRRVDGARAARHRPPSKSRLATAVAPIYPSGRVPKGQPDRPPRPAAPERARRSKISWPVRAPGPVSLSCEVCLLGVEA
jgi:hypothetical protein